MSFHSDHSDASVVAGIRAGDARVVDALFTHYFARLTTFAALYTGSVSSAEDVVSELFLWLWNHRDTWAPRTSVQSYLFGAVRNRALNAVRSAHRETRWNREFTGDDEPPAMGTPAAMPDTVLLRDDLAAAVRRAIAALPERAQEIVMLRWQNGMSFDEAAAILDITPAAAQKQYSRAIQALRTLLPDLLD